MKYLKSFNESFESDDLMTDEEIKQEVLQKINDLEETSNQWSSRDTLKEFTKWEFWSGEEMAIIDVEIAKKIASELYEYVEDLKAGSPEIDEVYELLYR
jgi:hypothetical protein